MRAQPQTTGQPLTSASATVKQWKPKLVSDLTVLAGGIGVLLLSFYAISSLLAGLDLKSLPDYLMPFFTAGTPYLIGGIILILAAIAGEIVSRLRTPPPTWRVKNELTRAMLDMSLVPNDISTWKGRFSVCPVGHWNHKAKCFSVPFMLRNVNATEDKFKSMEKSIAGFARSLDCTIEADNSKKLYNFTLMLWYTDNPYSQLEDYNPF